MAEIQLRTYPVDAKPGMGQIRDYFRQRLHGEQMGIAPSRDALGNWVFSSSGLQESTLHDTHPAQLVVSAQGRDILRRNRGLLHRIARGELEAEEIGEGQEGKVYKIELDTPDGIKPFALKYTFPIERDPEPDQDELIYTPGIDQMRWLQEVQRQSPLPNLEVAVPVLATMDITLTPFVENALEMNEVSRALFRIGYPIEDLPISDQNKAFLSSIRTEESEGNQHDSFRKLVLYHLTDVKKGLGDWFHTKVDNDRLDIVSQRVSIAEPESPSNLLVSLDKLEELYKRYKSGESIFQYDNPDFIDALRGCCTLIELSVGSKPKEESSPSQP